MQKRMYIVLDRDDKMTVPLELSMLRTKNADNR
jgi:hypothetical protein